MIKINKDFEIERYNHGWKLVQWFDGVNPKTQEPTRNSKNTYYPTVEQVCNQVLERSIGGCSDIEQVLESILVAKAEIQDTISENAKSLFKQDENEPS